MGFYARRVFPVLLDRAMQHADVASCRERLVPLAAGRVLEIGIGSGLNLPYYGGQVGLIVGLDPSAELLDKARSRTGGLGTPPVHLLRASAEAIPLASHSVDTVVMTWTLCSIPDPARALEEARRVLRPDGRLLFIEHGVSPEPRVEKWQQRLDPLWTRISCHLNRPVDRLLTEAGFGIGQLQVGYVGNGPKILTFMFQGWAQPKKLSAKEAVGKA